jgi:hypothetical protein
MVATPLFYPNQGQTMFAQKNNTTRYLPKKLDTKE